MTVASYLKRLKKQQGRGEEKTVRARVRGDGKMSSGHDVDLYMIKMGQGL